ncbi:hypothetical protein EVA_22143, partial [gut metagenome]
CVSPPLTQKIGGEEGKTPKKQRNFVGSKK